jgi:hypothetical protein
MDKVVALAALVVMLLHAQGTAHAGRAVSLLISHLGFHRSMPFQRHCQRLKLTAWRAGLVAVALCGVFATQLTAGEAPAIPASNEVDTALVLAVDVSDSVDAERYKLQMEGIAQSLESENVIASITSGPKGGIMLALVLWSNEAELSLPWTVIRTPQDALDFASRVRAIPQKPGEFTCVGRMMEFTRNFVIPDVKGLATRVAVDVSGDGIDNCRVMEETTRERDALVATGVTINGLPIIVKGENETVGVGAYRKPGYGLDKPPGPDTDQTTLDAWYEKFVIGGAAGFMIKANGFEDFGRAFRQKFVTELSWFDEEVFKTRSSRE